MTSADYARRQKARYPVLAEQSILVSRRFSWDEMRDFFLREKVKSQKNRG
jgi:hypothetical protein